MNRFFRTAGLVFIAGLCFVTTYAGLSDAWDNRTAAETVAQQWFAVLQLAYAVTGFAAGVTLLLRHPWARRFLRAWAVCMTLAATGAPVVWGESGVGPAIGAGVATLVVAVLLVLAAERLLAPSREQTAPGVGTGPS